MGRYLVNDDFHTCAQLLINQNVSQCFVCVRDIQSSLDYPKWIKQDSQKRASRSCVAFILGQTLNTLLLLTPANLVDLCSRSLCFISQTQSPNSTQIVCLYSDRCKVPYNFLSFKYQYKK